MVRNKLVTALLASSALMFAATAPAQATDKKDRAQEAIAAAEAKVHTAESLGTGVEMPAATAAARASLARAREDLRAGHKSLAIDTAIQAQAQADTAIGELQRRKNESLAAARASERATSEAASAQVSDARRQADDAQAQAASAQQDAASAHARADAAQAAAASSAADASAAREAAALAAARPTQIETTTTTTQPRTTVHHTTKKAVVKPKPAATTTVSRSPGSVTTTTKVTQP